MKKFKSWRLKDEKKFKSSRKVGIPPTLPFAGQVS